MAGQGQEVQGEGSVQARAEWTSIRLVVGPTLTRCPCVLHEHEPLGLGPGVMPDRGSCPLPGWDPGPAPLLSSASVFRPRCSARGRTPPTMAYCFPSTGVSFEAQDQPCHPGGPP